ncbi:MAG: hypothetical protein ACKV2O_18745 [Acidimicrobiales bacterium]
MVSAALAHRLASVHGGALLVDLGGDQPDILGVTAHTAPGVGDWLASGAQNARALSQLEVSLERVSPVRLLTQGTKPLIPGAQVGVLAAILARQDRPVVVDCGGPLLNPLSPAGEVALVMAGGATRSLLVLRPCLVSLRRALSAPLRPSALVVVTEEGRGLRAADVPEVLGVPLAAEVPVDPAVVRMVDAGLLLARLPRTLERGLRHAA